MKRSQPILLLVIALLMLPAVARAQQPWSGILSPARATDWTRAGVVGGIPSASWTQSGPTIAAYSGTAAAINAALSGCGANQYVMLGPGTFSLSSGIDFGHKSNCALRGSGANSTFLVFGSGVGTSCAGASTLICNVTPDAPAHYYGSYAAINWTAGYSQGTTTITLASVSGISAGMVIALNQCDTGYSGHPCVGSAVDNGNYFNCSNLYSASGPTGCSFNGPDGGNGTALRFETELFIVSSVNGGASQVTLDHGLMNPNWSSGQSPEAWVFTPVTNFGVENLTIDATLPGRSVASAIDFFNASNCWEKGLKIIKANVTPNWWQDTVHCTIQDSYFYKTQLLDSYGLRFTSADSNLVQNNIWQQIPVPWIDEGSDAGTVFSYNFMILDFYASDAMQASIRPHSGGDNLELIEGNVGAAFYNEDYHGSHFGETVYRNLFTGWESCGSGQCGTAGVKDYQTNAILVDAYNRYTNVIGNVLGTPGYHATYQDSSTPPASAKVIYALGTGNPGSGVPSDPLVHTTLLRWANYDTVTGAVRFCGGLSNTGWSTLCAITSEVPVGIGLYANQIPILGDTGAGQSAMPASFYLSSKPAWFGSVPWPPIGPDVSNGNVGVCSGTLNTQGQFAGVPSTSNSQCTGTSLTTGWAGHVNAIPAMNCALNVMGMPPDGSGGVLSFNASACYGGSSSSQSPNPPTNLIVVVN